MKETDIQSIRQRLLDQRAELESTAEVSSAAAQPVELDQTSVGRLSRMDAMQAQSMAIETERRRAAQLVRIEGALRRIEVGEFGCCFICGEEIETPRLDFDLTTTRCVGCKELV
jgi:DnaK suppressor protein